mgnify:CR=1 FL=1
MVDQSGRGDRRGVLCRRVKWILSSFFCSNLLEISNFLVCLRIIKALQINLKNNLQTD